MPKDEFEAKFEATGEHDQAEQTDVGPDTPVDQEPATEGQPGPLKNTEE